MVIWSKSISNWTLTSYCFVTILIIIMVTFGASNDFDLVASATPALGGFFLHRWLQFSFVDHIFHWTSAWHFLQCDSSHWWIFLHRWSYFSLEEHSTFLIVWLLVAGLPGDYYGWRPPTAATYMGFPRAMQKCKEKMKSQKYENTRAENEEALSIKGRKISD